MNFFPDVNVWIALVVAEHAHYKAANDWYDRFEWDALIFSRVTQMGFLRLLTNRHVMGDRVVSAKGAWDLLDQMCSSNRLIRLAAEPSGIENAWRTLTPATRSGPNFWTDAYLAAFAQTSGHTLLTFDRGFLAFKGIPLKILSSNR
jgi:uncharacterized protein